MKPGWEVRPLGDVCSTVTDGSHYSPTSVAFGKPYITVRDLDAGRINLHGSKRISTEDFLDLKRNGCQPLKGDVLFSKDGTVGKVAVVDTEEEFVVLSSLAILRPKAGVVLTRYLAYALQDPAFLFEALGRKTGVAIRRIVLKNLKSMSIPVPPLAEQERIVRILDEALDGIATAEANTDRARTSAKGIFNAYVDDAAEHLRDGWGARPLGELAVFRNGVNYTKSSKGASAPIVGVKDFRNNFEVPTAELAEVRLDGELQVTDTIRSGDILAVRSNGNPELIGRMMIVAGVDEPTTHSGFTIRIRPTDRPKCE